MKNRFLTFLAQNNATISSLVVIVSLVLAGVITLSQAAWGLAIGLIVFGVTYVVTRNRK